MSNAKSNLSRREISSLVSELKRSPHDYLKHISDPLIKKILNLHYIQNLEWWKVANAINYSEQNVYKLRRKALVQLSEAVRKERNS